MKQKFYQPERHWIVKIIITMHYAYTLELMLTTVGFLIFRTVVSNF